jgi:hypothetical protein
VSEYPPDEFDQQASAGGPVGVHRPKKGVGAKIAAPFIVFVLAGAAAYGVSVYLWQQSGGEGLPPGTVVTPTIIETVVTGIPEEPTTSPTLSPTASPSPSETAPPVDLATPVVVLNGAGIGGLAGAQAEELTAAGFSNVTASNLTGAKPAANTVRYADASQVSTAAQVAQVLGIAAVEQGATTAGGIDVLLVTNPDA